MAPGTAWEASSATEHTGLSVKPYSVGGKTALISWLAKVRDWLFRSLPDLDPFWLLVGKSQPGCARLPHTFSCFAESQHLWWLLVLFCSPLLLGRCSQDGGGLEPVTPASVSSFKRVLSLLPIDLQGATPAPVLQPFNFCIKLFLCRSCC